MILLLIYGDDLELLHLSVSLRYLKVSWVNWIKQLSEVVYFRLFCFMSFKSMHLRRPIAAMYDV